MTADCTTNNQNCPSTPSAEAEHDPAQHLDAEFLAVISHELRGPLAAIKGYAATLRRHGQRLGRAERDDYLQAIDDASSRLDVLISRLLEMAQLEAGTVHPHLAAVDMGHLVREALAAASYRLETTARDPSRFLFIAPEYTSTPPVLADLRLQREVLDILLENAVKYSPDGGIIRVTFQSDDKMLRTSVHDTGIGIQSEHLRRIFQRFYRVDTRLTRDVEGIGLGLAICKRILALQGGDIWAESEPGSGSSFIVTLPLLNPR
jgi:signal transduction histidine kinase